ncbi:replication protein A 70 kDa DNA-binding subunit A-like isoform X2 [Malus sylvestris]|uniref:replication protein A 70 kDa DNA-binding subunit A-like isoform X2 n=1 Tax=Malus sylvestris TaxID=3752 RepID=UPI0021AD2B19|nr:replication protein A 70 kDa DNA-binding subunit A-like isoform X2 [Malus sylvestris]
MKIDPIGSLSAFEFNKKIRVRVCRIWRPKVIGKDNTFGGLQCILVDEMNDAIQASTKEFDYEYVAPKIKANHVYEITRFSTSRCKTSYKIVPHDAQVCFNTKTNFEELPGVHPNIPSHRFYLLDYSQLSSRIDQDAILTVKPLEDRMIGNERMEKIREVKLQNIRKEDVNLTLWGDTAKTFDFEALEHLTPPVLGVFTSLKVRRFRGNIVLSSSISTMIFINPDIPEAAPYKAIFAGPAHSVKMLSTSARQLIGSEQLENAEKMSVQDLNILDPDLYKSTSILCRAAITRFDTHAGWWYKACPCCYKQLRKDDNNDMLICVKHNVQTPLPWFKVNLIIEDASDETSAIIIGKPAERLFETSCYDLVVKKGFTDQQELPYAILQCQGHIKNFQLRFENLKNDFNRNDLLIQAIFDDKIQAVQSSSQASYESLTEFEEEDTTTQNFSSTPPIFDKELKRISSTISPTVVTTSPTKSSIRKSLFSSENRKKQKRETKITEEIDEQNISDTEDFPIKSLKNKVSPSKSEIVFTASKTRKNKCKDD